MSRGNMRVDVECDGCGRVESFTVASHDIAAAAAAAAAAAGWLSNTARDQDLCASCFVERVGSRVLGILL